MGTIWNILGCTEFTPKQKWIGIYLALSVCLLCVLGNAPLLVLAIVVLNLYNAVRLIKKYPLPN